MTKFKILGEQRRRRCYGTIWYDRNQIKVNLVNQRNGKKNSKKNNELFKQLIVIINKYYDLEDQNHKPSKCINRVGYCLLKKYRIERMIRKN